MNIYVIGSGWYGCHTALSLAKRGHTVTILEKNNDIFQGTSGQFGIRLHAGPHYPRSEATRVTCRRSGEEFKQQYPELLIPHQYSVYGLGDFDADRQPSKVSKEVFDSVCSESLNNEVFDPNAWGYKHLISAAHMEEPSIVLGKKLREHFRQLLQDSGITVHFNVIVTSLEQKEDEQIAIHLHNEEVVNCDRVINASGYQSVLPNDVDASLDIQVAYQPCLAMVYRDKQPEQRPFSFIVMDGWFPCIMPYVTGEEGQEHQYILTHGKWTIMGTFDSAAKANRVLNTLSTEYILEEIKPRCEQEINRFWPEFANRFEFIGWKGSVLAKLNTKNEFRSAVTYAEGNVIHIIPGKVTNIFDAEKEVHCLLDNSNTISNGRFRFVRDGVYNNSIQEIIEKSTAQDRSTYSLQTLKELAHKPEGNSSLRLLWDKIPQTQTNASDVTIHKKP